MPHTPKIPRGWRKIRVGEKLKKNDQLHFDDGSKPEWDKTSWKPGTVLTAGIVEVNGIYIRKIK